MTHGALRRNIVLSIVLIATSAFATPESAYRLFREGCVYWFGGDAVKAHAIFQSISQPLDRIDDLRLYALADSALASGRSRVAAAGFEKLIADYPESPWRRAAEKKLAMLRHPPEPNPLPEDLEERATLLFRERNYQKAAPLLKELLRKKGGDDIPLMTMLASAYARSGQYDGAITLQRQLAQFPQEARKALYKIVFLQADRGRDREAVAAAAEFLEKYSKGTDSHKVMWMQAWSLFRLKDWTGALRQFEAYHSTVGSQEEKNRAAYWMARTLDRMGNSAGAATAYGLLSGRASGYYGMLASARLRHKPMTWQLPPSKRMPVLKIRPESAATLLASLGLYELAPVAGWGGDYHSLVAAAANNYGLTGELVSAIITVESHHRQNAVSPAGAVGLMQLIPPTAERLSREMHLEMFEVADLRNPIWNVTLGMGYLQRLSRMFDRQLVALIASYNAGEEAVSRWIQKNNQPHGGGEGGTRTALPGGGATLAPIIDQEMFIEAIPYDETQDYVKKVLLLIPSYGD